MIVIGNGLKGYQDVFLAIPESLRIYFAILVLVMVIIAVIQIIRRNFLWIIILILFLPAIIPALQLLGVNIGFNPADLIKK